MVHYVMMSTEHDYSPGSRQYKWLDNDLSSVNRKITPWVIIAGHRAMYCSESYASKSFLFTYSQPIRIKLKQEAEAS